ncbi:2-hydroxyacid dehydrogenase [Anaerosacchariphilus polymeriproducens]|uniref:Hydroxyacid dehydrogenase n=1 Tax=Anaerosacchariphilus polymeriproducens TaxID=1812858 RepID=A0A371AX19_9FIRM|nr:2-hydroxyacid dehydrogenase [Anaerosacchariphilus polymeriproducens]RDU24091.1 hydroxyacid dehydrogenase [Anaerosacchariphilus polymeriproducens]
MKIVLIEPLGIEEAELKKLSRGITEGGHEFVSYDSRTEDTKELIQRGKDADIIILTNLPFRKEVIEQCTQLKMISVAFTGVDHVDVAYCDERQIIVSNAAGYATNAVAELAIGLMVGLYRNMLACDLATRDSKTKQGLIGFEMAGKTLGVVGTGAIGSQVIDIALAFGCQVIAYSRTKKEALEQKGVRYVDLETLLKESDIVTLHLPLNESSKHLIGAKEIQLMKPTALLINTARGPVVDSQSLASALNNGQIAGAGIDVFEIEPPINQNHPLLHSKNTIVTPHVAFATKESLVKRAIITFDNVKAFLKGKPINISSSYKGCSL